MSYSVDLPEYSRMRKDHMSTVLKRLRLHFHLHALNLQIGCLVLLCAMYAFTVCFNNYPFLANAQRYSFTKRAMGKAGPANKMDNLIKFFHVDIPN